MKKKIIGTLSLLILVLGFGWLLVDANGWEAVLKGLGTTAIIILLVLGIVYGFLSDDIK